MGGEEESNERGASLEVQIAISLWVQSRMAKRANRNPKVVELMPLMFKTLDAMYLETRNLPFFARSGATGRPKNNSDSFIFGLWLKDADYVTLRSILALAGDLIYVLEKLVTLPGLLELGRFMTPLYKQANQFRDARDFLPIWMMLYEIIQNMGSLDLPLWNAAYNSRLMPKIMFM
jgi:hypothetical protein